MELKKLMGALEQDPRNERVLRAVARWLAQETDASVEALAGLDGALARMHDRDADAPETVHGWRTALQWVCSARVQSAGRQRGTARAVANAMAGALRGKWAFMTSALLAGPRRPMELVREAARAGVRLDKATASRELAEMVAAGWVEQLQLTGEGVDGRAVIYRLTERGRARSSQLPPFEAERAPQMTTTSASARPAPAPMSIALVGDADLLGDQKLRVSVTVHGHHQPRVVALSGGPVAMLKKEQ